MYKNIDISDKLKKIGLKKKDNIFCSASFGMLGPIDAKVKKLDELTSFFFLSIKNIIGENGTIFTPSYSYSFGNKNFKKNNFNISKTSSRVGPLGNFILKNKDHVRSIDPMVSIVGIGPKAKILKSQKKTSYGKGCMYEKLLRINNLKILNIGVGINYIPFMHYIDYLTKCKHRYKKIFKGTIQIGNIKKKSYWEYHVPFLRSEAISDGQKIAKIKDYKRLFKKTNFKDGYFYLADYKECFNVAFHYANINPWITALGPEFNE